MNKPFTHTGTLVACRGKEISNLVQLRETKTCYITQHNIKYRKSDGYTPNEDWPHYKLDLQSIKPIKLLRPIKITYQDGNTLVTSINGSKDEVNAYYLGKSFNLGPEDHCTIAIKVEFLDDNNT